MLEDLSFKKSTIAKGIDNIQNLANYSLTDRANLNILSSANKCKFHKTDDTKWQSCDCEKIKNITNENMPEIKYNSDGTIKIKEFIDADITFVRNVKKDKIEDIKDLHSFDIIPYNSCKAVLGKCIVSGTGTINENCLCAKMAIDDSPMIYHEISELTPLPYQE